MEEPSGDLNIHTCEMSSLLYPCTYQSRISPKVRLQLVSVTTYKRPILHWQLVTTDQSQVLFRKPRVQKPECTCHKRDQR